MVVTGVMVVTGAGVAAIGAGEVITLLTILLTRVITLHTTVIPLTANDRTIR